jgi:hypothetical protein
MERVIQCVNTGLTHSNDVWGRLSTMAEKRFVVFLIDGTMQPVTADSGDQDEEADGYVFFVDSKGEIVGLFHKEIVKSWREDPDPCAV